MSGRRIAASRVNREQRGFHVIRDVGAQGLDGDAGAVRSLAREATLSTASGGRGSQTTDALG